MKDVTLFSLTFGSSGDIHSFHHLLLCLYFFFSQAKRIKRYSEYYVHILVYTQWLESGKRARAGDKQKDPHLFVLVSAVISPCAAMDEHSYLKSNTGWSTH